MMDSRLHNPVMSSVQIMKLRVINTSSGLPHGSQLRLICNYKPGDSRSGVDGYLIFPRREVMQVSTGGKGGSYTTTRKYSESK